jgi:hypothetical protein
MLHCIVTVLTQPRGLPEQIVDWWKKRVVMRLTQSTGLTIHVVVKGEDSGLGSQNAPQATWHNSLKVPKCEIFDRSDFHYFYTIKPFWGDDFVVKILTFYFNFWGSQASFSF